MGAQLVKEVASKTNDIAGDGTTTATVLAQAIIREGLRNVPPGLNPLQIKRGVDEGGRSDRQRDGKARSKSRHAREDCERRIDFGGTTKRSAK